MDRMVKPISAAPSSAARPSVARGARYDGLLVCETRGATRAALAACYDPTHRRAQPDEQAFGPPTCGAAEKS